jgi:hypothetical protein
VKPTSAKLVLLAENEEVLRDEIADVFGAGVEVVKGTSCLEFEI